MREIGPPVTQKYSCVPTKCQKVLQNVHFEMQLDRALFVHMLYEVSSVSSVKCFHRKTRSCP